VREKKTTRKKRNALPKAHARARAYIYSDVLPKVLGSLLIIVRHAADYAIIS
jgi:hypothetical protein